jgi:hypothetical protein
MRLASVLRSKGSNPWTFTQQAGGNLMSTILWIIAVIFVISGVFALFRSQLILGIVLIVVGLLIGPGGVSVFS